MTPENHNELRYQLPPKLKKPIVSLEKKQGYSKISAILLLTAFILASALTVLLVQNTAS